MLTQDQIAHFETFGFLLFRQCFPKEEFETIMQVADDLWERELGQSSEGEEHLHVVPFLEQDPRLLRLIEDDRVYGPVHRLLGDDFLWSGSEGNRGFQPGNTSHHWHADRPGEKELGYIRIKIMLYMEPMRKETGALRIIPGSHRLPLHENLMSFQRRHSEDAPTFFGMPGFEVPCYAFETEPGDMVLFNHSLFHSVYGKQGRRRYMAMKFAAKPTCDADLASVQWWSKYAFQPDEALLNSDSPRLQGMVKDLADLGARAQSVVRTYYDSDEHPY